MLASGAALAHGVTAAALPVLSRMYAPEHFSVLAVFAGLMSVCAVGAALRFDLAVPLPESLADALNLVVLGVLSALAFAVILALGIAVAGDSIVAATNLPALSNYLWLLPVSVVLASVGSVLQYWSGRRGQFALLACSRLAQSSTTAGTQIALGLVPLAPLGLVAGQIVNSAVGCVWLGSRMLREHGAYLRVCVSRTRLRELFVEYRQFPTFSTLEAFANAAAVHVPLILIAKYAAGGAAGQVMLAMTVMQAPMSLIGAAVGQVYVSQAAMEYRAGALGKFTGEAAARLARLGVGPLLAVGIAGPAVFPILFGHAWDRAGELVAWMTPWFILQFVAAPLGLALHVTGHQRTALLLQVSGLALRVAAVAAAGVWITPRVGEAYAVSGALFYLVYCVVVFRTVGTRGSDVLRQLRRSAGAMLAWGIGGAVVGAAAGLWSR